MKTREFTKLPLMTHQRCALRKSWGRHHFALLHEQGTGKTLCFIAEALAMYAKGMIDGMFVLAPNGVHENWVLNELPVSVPDDVPYVAAYYATNANRKERAALDEVMTVRKVGEVMPLRVLTMSYDSLMLERGWSAAIEFLNAVRCVIVADESHKIKGHDSKRTRRVINIGGYAEYRRIGTGTAITNSPMDAWSQFEFLAPGEALLGAVNYSAFRAEYAELLPPGHGVVRHVIDRIERKKGRVLSDKERSVLTPQIIAQDELGRPKYRNLDKLQRLVGAHSHRVLKEECMDLPPKVFETRYFHLTPAQRLVYERMAEEYRYLFEDGTALITSKLVALGKLRQITSGFILLRDGTTQYIEDNPRIELLRSEVEGVDFQCLIWAQYREELRNIDRMIRELGMTVAVVNGDTPMKQRREIRADFQAGNIQWVAAHPGTLGTGFTLTKARMAYFYSNGFQLDERLQAEDRNHRKGTEDQGWPSVLYRDFVAIDTRDDDVVWSLQHKLDTAAMVYGDPQRRHRWAAPKGENSPSSRK